MRECAHFVGAEILRYLPRMVVVTNVVLSTVIVMQTNRVTESEVRIVPKWGIRTVTSPPIILSLHNSVPRPGVNAAWQSERGLQRN
jgi:hypothetical protein